MSTSANADNADNDAPVPCANDCGFWGRPSTANYCSACYKQKVGSLKKESDKIDAKPKTETSASVQIEEPETVEIKSAKVIAVEQGKAKNEGIIPVKVEASAEPQEVTRPVQVNRMRCFTCRTKVGITGTECRCGYVFCGAHRYPEEHQCSFDFRSLAQSKVVQKSEAAMADKIKGERL